MAVGGAPTVTTGKISNCYYFDGNDRLIQSTLLTTFPSECSYECWVNIDDLGASIPYQIFMGSENDHSADQFKLYYDPSPNYIVGNAENAGSGPVYVHTSPNIITENTWFFAAYTYKANEAVKLYLNSNEYIADSTTGHIGNGNDYDFELASTRGGTKSFLTGWIDETRVSKVRRSSAWIETSYNTMNNPSNFLSFGAEEKPRQKAYNNILFLWFLEGFPMLERLLNFLR